ncbi:MAG TPA: hypothetical protein VEK11_13075 [Thermoanaerobaculia bacterium]|jgi:hypothetical protein|nr:hypothetical protein [Thermoanaerobaculia bacterium]
MRVAVALFAAIVLALPLAAANDQEVEYEQLLLTVAPSIVHCARDSRYETRLIAYNGDESARTLCPAGRCMAVEPNTGAEFTGDYAGGVPLPVFMYVPKEEAARMRFSLMVESSELNHPEDRAYTELPIVRASDFREGKMQFIGVRLDEDFRQTVRTYGLDGRQTGHLIMRVYSLKTGELEHSCLHYVGPLSETPELTADGRQLRPSFGMECNMADHVHAHGQKVRIELESLTPGLKYWAFLSITNNKTQHFYTVLPQ